jgi:tetratricopeptide (TPR) repeat protein
LINGVAAMRRAFRPLGLLVLAAVVLATAGPALGNPPAKLTDMFARGDYMEAAAEAELAASADDLAFAARSLLAHCMTGTQAPEAAIVDRASKDAEAALKLDPGHEEGRLQLAIALSLKSRTMGLLDAWSAGYGDKGRSLVSEVLAKDPANFYAHGFLAVWNVEVFHRGGSIGATFMGASLKEARRQYDAAVRLAPDDVGIHWQYGRALAALDVKDHGAEAIEVLGRAVAAKADDHVEKIMQDRAVRLLQALKGDRRIAQLLARELL